MKITWKDISNVDELKKMGSVGTVKSAMSSDFKLDVKARGWDDLLIRIITFNKSFSNTPLKTYNQYFKSKAHELAFYLMEIDGEIQMEKLGINQYQFNNIDAAKKWRGHLLNIVHPDHFDDDLSNGATNAVYEIYKRMKKHGRK